MSDAEEKPPDRVDGIINWFRNHRFFAPIIVFTIVIGVIVGFWKPIFGESVAATVLRLWNDGVTYEQCLENANNIMTEIIKCHTDFGKL